jgi:hypothetical protein
MRLIDATLSFFAGPRTGASEEDPSSATLCVGGDDHASGMPVLRMPPSPLCWCAAPAPETVPARRS